MYFYVSIFIVALVTWMLHRFNYFRQLHKFGLPGPRANIFTGNMREYLYGQKPCHLVVDDWLKKYGDIFGFHLGLHRYVVVKNPEILRDVFIRNFRANHCRPLPSITIAEFADSIIQVRDFNKWKRLRTLMTPCFSAAKIKHMWPMLCQCTDTMLEVVDKAVRQREGVVEVQAMFQGLSCDVIASCLLALKSNCQLDQTDPFLTRVRDFFDHAASFLAEAAYSFPVISFIIHALIRTFKLTEQMIVMIFDNFSDVMAKRRAQPLTVKHRDVLQALMDAGEDLSTRRQPSLSDFEIKSSMLVLLLAGYETTANHLTFTVYLLAKHPDIQERVYSELAEKCELNDELTFDHLASLPYMDQVISESLRLYPPVVTFVCRHMDKSSRLAGYQLPDAVTVMAPVWSLHRDSQLWPEPDAFDPDRFSSDGPQQRASTCSMGASEYVWLPFGLGPKSCIGQRFALVETKLTLFKILQRYSLSLVSPKRADLKIKVPTVIICTDEPVLIAFSPRNGS